MADEVKTLDPNQAWKLLQEQARAVLIDVRSSMEYLFVGHPRGSVHVAWIDEPDWVVNPHFVTDVRKRTQCRFLIRTAFLPCRLCRSFRSGVHRLIPPRNSSCRIAELGWNKQTCIPRRHCSTTPFMGDDDERKAAN